MFLLKNFIFAVGVYVPEVVSLQVLFIFMYSGMNMARFLPFAW